MGVKWGGKEILCSKRDMHLLSHRRRYLSRLRLRLDFVRADRDGDLRDNRRRLVCHRRFRHGLDGRVSRQLLRHAGFILGDRLGFWLVGHNGRGNFCDFSRRVVLRYGARDPDRGDFVGGIRLGARGSDVAG